MVERQFRADGSYLVDLGSRAPTVLTGFVAEGVGAAWRLAEDLGDRPRARRYADSHRAAMGFLDRLLVRREDTYWMADPDRALGGVRAALATADLRIDYTGHTLSALLHAVSAPCALCMRAHHANLHAVHERVAWVEPRRGDPREPVSLTTS
ncbi:MAG TPA: hypothetical protein VGH76_26655 [Actinomycetospora sp.]|jgi:hypothetical protein|uniref:hypothetical protein n=1 Tax=Actinomycetospora sp. TaxID=1872135 RepID=UPI002F3E7055